MGETTTQVLKIKNAIIRIHRPVLTDEERAKRMKAIELAAINLARANHQAEALKAQTYHERTEVAGCSTGL